jgi:beta-ureidopropionase / N-carbamoyl-L-amino-acid hydrolase
MRQRGSLLVYLELHIEQGRRLEQAATPLGIVTGIVGIRRYEVRVRGAAAHSGTTPMNDRRDAFAGVAEVILSVERLARERGRDGEFVGTVGQLTVVPGGANVVPGETTATVELRALDDRTLDEAELELREDARDQAASRGLELTFDEISRTAPVELDGDMRALLARAARAAGTDTLQLGSGGGHDAGHVAAIAPSAMLFIPCRDGVSHAPEEAADPEHIALGADVLFRVLIELAGRRR